MTELDDRILSNRETAKYLGIHTTSLWRLIRDGDFIEPIRIGKRAGGFLKSEVVAWVASRQRGLRPAVCGKSAAA
jgi:predicted DNA-binding transcriptional regulator AlpA